MKKLRCERNSYYIENKKEFQEGNIFKNETIDIVFNFAYEMTFGSGEHRDHRSGGVTSRKKGQIFINTFQGKLSELAIYNIFYKINKDAYLKLSKPDFQVYGLGEWDDSDITLNNIKFSIKSTKYYGNLLLLETKDWNINGEYIPNINTDKNQIYDYFVLVRIKPDSEQLMIKNKLLYSNNINKNLLYNIIKSEKWEYDIAGYMTNDDLKYIIKNNYVIPQNALLNGRIIMDAENYYIQSGDMKDFRQLIDNI